MLIRMALTVTALLLCEAFAQEKPNFSGTWKLLPEMSRLDGVDAPKSLTLTIDHREPALRITSEAEGKRGRESESLELKTDGSVQVNSGEGRSATSSAYWDDWTGERLVWTVTRDTPEGKVEVRRRAKLGDKGKILTTVATVKSSKGETKFYEWFVRQ